MADGLRKRPLFFVCWQDEKELTKELSKSKSQPESLIRYVKSRRLKVKLQGNKYTRIEEW